VQIVSSKAKRPTERKLGDRLKAAKGGGHTPVSEKTERQQEKATAQPRANLVLNFNALALLSLGRPSLLCRQGIHLGTWDQPTLVNFTVHVKFTSGWQPPIKYMGLMHNSVEALLQQFL